MLTNDQLVRLFVDVAEIASRRTLIGVGILKSQVTQSEAYRYTGEHQ